MLKMPKQQQTTQTTPKTNPETAASSAGRGREGGRGGIGRGGRGGRGTGNFRQRRASNLQAIINIDRDFEGKVPTIGVIGLSSEQNLRNSLQLGDFNQ